MTWQDKPPASYYPRLLPHVISLCFRYKAPLSIITKANPAIKYGGLPFDSKYLISELFSESSEFLKFDLIKEKLSLSEKLDLAKRFIQKVNYPVILKPDTSYRGIDISLIENNEQLETHLKRQSWDYIIQEYCNYDYEFGVFYYLGPNKSKGEIVSLSEKILPKIIGNGVDIIKDLILNSDLDLKENLLQEFKDSSESILPKGERLKAVVANHTLGGICKDRSELNTEDLLQKIDQICNIPDFYYGRLDIKAKSIADLKEGKFKIIEVNGAVSEFVHIYDKKYSLKEALKESKRQWNLLFEISNFNRHKSNNDLNFWQFAKKFINFFQTAKKITGKSW